MLGLIVHGVLLLLLLLCFLNGKENPPFPLSRLSSDPSSFGLNNCAGSGDTPSLPLRTLINIIKALMCYIVVTKESLLTFLVMFAILACWTANI